jgi:hypothetical protein
MEKEQESKITELAESCKRLHAAAEKVKAAMNQDDEIERLREELKKAQEENEEIRNEMREDKFNFNCEVLRLQSEIERLKGLFHEWVALAECLPEIDHEVLVCIQKFGSRYPYYRVGYISSDDNQWWIYYENGEHRFKDSVACKVDYCSITHWKPIK